MADRLTLAQRQLNMSRIRSHDTGPERLIRKLLHNRGFRFRLQRRDLPGRPDLVLPKYRVAIQVHGCFWHWHDCRLFVMPATRTEFWSDKLGANRRRDSAVREALEAAGWRTLLIWECALKGRGRLQSDELADRMADFIFSGDTRAHIAGSWAEGPRTV
ncbi:very short patch repair endonuclease [Sphingopyxis sp. R3-92]|uniref:very short patch repair endonuclease n=1 Tax=Sphingopyxis sp. R3-92 TaxID=3158553 RepID=UPI003EE67E5C